MEKALNERYDPFPNGFRDKKIRTCCKHSVDDAVLNYHPCQHTFIFKERESNHSPPLSLNLLLEELQMLRFHTCHFRNSKQCIFNEFQDTFRRVLFLADFPPCVVHQIFHRPL